MCNRNPQSALKAGATASRISDESFHTMDRPDETPAAKLVMVVQRGDDERYELLRKLFQGHRVDVVRDRRVGDRRRQAPADSVGDNRRAAERRAAMPDSWVNLGFFVAKRK